MKRKVNYQPPFPYFGGKSPVASLVWDALGQPRNYVEPFFGSGAVLFLRPGGAGNVETVNDADGFVCVAPQTRVLDSELRWRPAGNINPGDRLVGFDEYNGPPQVGVDRRLDRPAFQPPTTMRRWRVSSVLSITRRLAECYRLTFEDGTAIICSEDHLWLSGKSKIGGRGARWIKTKNLRCDSSQYASHVMKLCDVTEQEDTFDSGWLSGFTDGEGSIKGTGHGWAIAITQKHGPELDRCERLLKGRGFVVSRVKHKRTKEHHKPTSSLLINGGMREILRFLMLTRPERLIETAISRLPERSIYARERQVVRLIGKDYLGVREVVSITTDTKTFVAEGLASHNCNFWRALQRDCEAVAEAADNPVNEIDLHARHLWLIGERERITDRLAGDPEFYDAKAAGWWAWGLCCWIGGGWCSGNGPWQSVDGKMVLGNTGQGVKRQRPHLGPGQGLNRKLPHLGHSKGVKRRRPDLGNGKGVNRKLPHLGDPGQGSEPETPDEITARLEWLKGYLRRFAARLRNVRVCCGDWSRVCGPSVTYYHGPTGVYLDPPYADTAGRNADIYAVDCQQVAHDVREWAIEQGKNPLMRIVMSGYEGEHQMPDDWRVIEWEAHGGYGHLCGDKEGKGLMNSHRERLWLSPACRKAAQQSLFTD